ncbi:hypothetical protein JXI42_13030 [bacterium]|nr:hypothetical protein [bacterium]
MIKKIGKFLFKHRGLTPVPLVVVMVLLLDYRYPFEGIWNELSDLFGIIVALVGEFIRIRSIASAPAGTSGRGRNIKADSLRTTGMYSHVRHPLYLANFLIGLGFCILVGSWWVYAAYLVLFAFQYRLIIEAEEHFLFEKFDAEFENWAKHVPRFFPTFADNPYKNQSEVNRSSVKKILRREQDTASLIFVTFFLWKIWEYLRISGYSAKKYEIITTSLVLLLVLATWLMLKSWKKGWLFFRKAVD